jgi:uncharacterized membrane protein YeaQ/YmgE (transglycosylase-associated protein family)
MEWFQGVGAFFFGVTIGWYAYSVTRNRADSPVLADLATMIGAVGGGAVLALFPAGSDLFAAYGIGLAAGFFTYFLVLLRLVVRNKAAGWTTELFLDGRRPPLREGQERAPVPAMGQDVYVPGQLPD